MWVVAYLLIGAMFSIAFGQMADARGSAILLVAWPVVMLFAVLAALGAWTRS